MKLQPQALASGFNAGGDRTVKRIAHGGEDVMERYTDGLLTDMEEYDDGTMRVHRKKHRSSPVKT